jgi:serine/threonine-protein kinase RsbW
MASAMALPKILDDLTRMEKSPRELEWNYAAKTDSLYAALGAIEQACKAWNIDAGLISRARIVVEELFSNTIKYGYGGECDGGIRIRLAADPGLTLVYEDDAPLFDPTHWKSDTDEHVRPDERPEGQAGIAMVMGLCATAVYRPRNGCNALTLTFGAQESSSSSTAM